MMEIKNVVIVGAGLMGTGIAQVAIQAGYHVTLVDIKQEFVDKSYQELEKTLAYLAKKDRLGGTMPEALLANVKTSIELADAVKEADLVVEAAIENMKIKQQIFRTLAENSPAECILASNTSSMSITEIASATSKPEKCVGIHFFNPVPMMRLVEVIKGDQTSEATMDIAQQWAQGLPCRGPRYVPKVLKDRPGFLANRMIAPAFILMDWAYNQAQNQGIPWEQLEADTKQEGHPMGYLELADYIGHDTVLHINEYYAQTLSPEFQPSKFYHEMIEAGKLGRKSKQGFFDWSAGRPKLDLSQKAGLVTAEELNAIEANEGCRILEEGVVHHWEIIDQTMEAAFNRPGVMHLAVDRYTEWAALLEQIAEKVGKDYLKPTELLKSGKFVAMK